ncbi:MAG TPA: hypothetical protein VEI53_08560 [Ktedonobacteraceae bacterium]|nr:hypothetical protein [Ktedonobacteraceae bacterium]
MAVYVKLAELPQVFPAILSGLTTRSTPVTVNGTCVGDAVGVTPAPLPGVVVPDTLPGVGELEELLELLPHAAKLNIARQMKTKLINGRFNMNFS